MRCFIRCAALPLIVGVLVWGCTESDTPRGITDLSTSNPSPQFHTQDNPFLADLIADGGSDASAEDAGDLLVWNDADHLYVKYDLEAVAWCLMETHLHVATAMEGIPQKKGNPIPGQFSFSSVSDPCANNLTYVIPLDLTGGPGLVIAAHAEVRTLIGYAPDLPGFESALPNQVTMVVAEPGTGFGTPSYYDLIISGGTTLDGTRDGYSIDTDNLGSTASNDIANVYSSYEALPAGLVEYPEDLDLVNWILNQGFEEQASPDCGGSYTYGDVQRAIWEIVEDAQSTYGLGAWSQCRVDEILAGAVAYGEGFVPGCGDDVGVIFQYVDGARVTIAGVELSDPGAFCIPVYRYETAWGDGLNFPGRSWATYITYGVQSLG